MHYFILANITDRFLRAAYGKILNSKIVIECIVLIKLSAVFDQDNENIHVTKLLTEERSSWRLERVPTLCHLSLVTVIGPPTTITSKTKTSSSSKSASTSSTATTTATSATTMTAPVTMTAPASTYHTSTYPAFTPASYSVDNSTASGSVSTKDSTTMYTISSWPRPSPTALMARSQRRPSALTPRTALEPEPAPPSPPPILCTLYSPAIHPACPHRQRW